MIALVMTIIYKTIAASLFINKIEIELKYIWKWNLCVQEMFSRCIFYVFDARRMKWGEKNRLGRKFTVSFFHPSVICDILKMIDSIRNFK